MRVRYIRAGEVLELSREPVDVDLGETYRQIGVRGFGRGIFDYDPVAGEQLGKLRYFTLGASRLVVSNIKGWEGAVAVTGESETGRIASNRFLTYRTDREVELGYIRHYLVSEPGLDALGKASPGSADRNRTLSIKNFENIVIPLPDLDEQRRIAAHLDTLSGASLSLDSALMDGLGPLLDSVFDQFKWDTELSELLELDVNEFEVDPNTLYSQAGVFGGGRGMFLRGGLLGSETKYSRLRRVSAGQVVLSRLKAFEGAVAVLPDALHGSVLSQEFPTFSVRDGVELGFVSGLIGRHRFTEAMQSRSTGVGARRERLSVDGFLKIRVPLPTPDVQAKAGRLVRHRQRLDAAVSMRARLTEVLLPAARNEIFSAMA